MTRNTKNLAENNQCPQCSLGQMLVADNSRFRYCDHCKYRIEIAAPSLALQKLIEDTTRAPLLADSTYKAKLSNSLRIWLGRGITAAQAGEMDEAYAYLAKILRESWDHEDRVEAWVWLSRVVLGLEGKKYCLERVLIIEPAHGYARKHLAILDGRLNPDEVVDFEMLQIIAKDESMEIEVDQFVCPRCAGPMRYHSTEKVLLCEHCNYQQRIDNNSHLRRKEHFGEGAYEQEFTIALATAKGHLSPVQMRTFQCHSCAVEFILSPETVSITCPYCRAVYVTETAESREIIPPHALIPFQFDEGQIRKILHRWFKKHRIKHPRILFILGIYLPVWTFDLSGNVKWTKRDNRELLGLGFFDSPYVRKDDAFPFHKPQIKRFDSQVEKLSGMKLVFYDDILVPASKKFVGLKNQFTEYDLSKLVSFDSRYLAAWPAERYQVPLADASLQARKTVAKDIRKNAYKFTHERILDEVQLNTTGLVIESYKQLLLPTWTVHYQIDKQRYKVTINGQTGRVYGSRPKGKIERLFSFLLGS